MQAQSYILILGIVLTSCKEKNSGNEKPASAGNNQTTELILTEQYDSMWIAGFREFRDAVYQRNKSKVKTFIDFPIMNENNEIWYLVYGENEKETGRLTEKIKTFTEQDFDKYFDQLFSKRFISSILKLKTADLAKTGEIETIEFKDGDATTYKMHATVDKAKKTLTLNLFSHTVIKDKEGEVQDGGEFSVIYIFTFSENGQLNFTQIRLAG